MELLKTGITGLDEILCGGLVPFNSYLIKGTPGSGKTTLGVQTLLTGIEHNEMGMIVTFEERPEKLFRDFANYGWDLRRLEAEGQLKVISSSPAAAKEMLSNPDSLISRYIAEHHVQRLLIDSLSSFARLERDTVRLREIVQQFISSLIVREVTPLLIMEMPQIFEQNVSFEEYLTDAVIQLTYEQRGDRRRQRYLEVLKTRGHRYLEGRHTMKIGVRGLEVFPSCQPLPEGYREMVSALPERETSGVSGLDELLSGGFPRGSSVLIAGSSGTGKSTVANQFLAAGARKGQRVLVLFSQENPSQLQSLTRSIGIDISRLERERIVHTHYISPVNLSVDEFFHRVKSLISARRFSRVIIDSLSDVLSAIKDEDYLRDFMHSLTELFRMHHITSLMTYDVGDMFGSFNVRHSTIPGLVDNLIFLRYVEMEGTIARALSVLKMRACQHDKGIHEIVTTASGIAVKKRFEGREGLMAGSTKKSIIEMDEIIDHVSRLESAKRKFKHKKSTGFDSDY